jgi:lipopolysaccharide biosynthesis protein
MKNKFIPFYFPQLHRIPENDLWWGEGYTDWDRVKTSKPLDAHHNQPRVPLNNNYYDQSEEDTLLWQIKLAKEYGIHGFNFYHYWFDGKLLLEKPIELFKKINHDLGYCITWANETWSKRWDGKFNEVLIKQNHNKDFDEWEKHYSYLEQFFTDPRYIRVDNKPVFMIYRPDIFPDVSDFIIFFNEKAIKSGLDGLHFVAIKAYEVKDQNIYDGFDAFLRFQPRDLFGSDLKKKSKTMGWVEKTLRSLPEQHQLWLGDLRQKFQKNVTYNFDEFWQHLLKNAKNDLSSSKEIYQSILPDWDNTARYGNKSKYFTGVTSEKFEKYLKELLSIEEMKDKDEALIFINAWNEWSEGAYLEPDMQSGFKNLEILKKLAQL